MSSITFSNEAMAQWMSFRTTMRAAMADEEICASFESFSEYISKPATLKAALLLLKSSRCNLLLKPSPRTLLAAFMVARFPADILELSPEELADLTNDRFLDRSCHQAAQELVQVFTSDQADADLGAALTMLNSFQALFVEWKEYDRQRVLQSLSNAHWQWVQSLEHLEANKESTKDPESMQIMIESVQEQMEANKRRILQMGGPEALEQVFANPPMVINLDEIVAEMGSRQFWEEFAGELRQSPPKYDRIAVLLTEIRDRLKALVPSRPDVQRTIEMGLDVDFIRQMIEFGSFDSATFLRVFQTIWTHLKNFGAASAEAEWTAWSEEILGKAANTTWDILVPEIFNRFLRQLDLIEEATEHYRRILEENQTVAAGSSA